MTKANDIKAGTILTATPELQDPAFGKSVMLVIHHDEEATVAVNIAGEAVVPGPAASLHLGGPMETPPCIIFKQSGDLKEGIVADTGYIFTQLPQEEGPVLAQLIMTGQLPPELDIKNPLLVIGYAAWGAGQIDEEKKAGVWQHTEKTLDDLMIVTPDKRWELATAVKAEAPKPKAKRKPKQTPPKP